MGAYALLIVVIRVFASLAARALRRPAISVSIACYLMYSFLLALLVAVAMTEFRFSPLLTEETFDYGFGMTWPFAVGLALIILIDMLRALAPEAATWRRFAVAALVPLACFFTVYKSEVWSTFYYGGEYAESTQDESDEYAEVESFDYDSEDLLAIQDDLVDAQLELIQPQRANQVDLYLIVLAGDDSQDVFIKEATFVQEQFDTRFGTAGRSVALINHADTLEDTAMATNRNLRRALAGLNRKIDPLQDIVFLFMTSHGSADHEWSAQLADIPLRQITPEDIAEAFDDAGIRWRVTVISACYSGGFIDALAADTSLVITASRADRTSFGCSNDADLTYFGRAYFADALKTSDDFIAAQSVATKLIREREIAENLTASEPQVSVGSLVPAQLAAWRSGLPAKP